ncbi:TetR/AcrR family transcriptional regulator C-terminal domain-containing protein [Saxibacter everestensis]|uniref:TetR/AcrR family transcriptional regulator C-terminal domain-containing protein n=1 Tax=Saxibacter everestensis TaxID=2909229 RepID=A0ABY8QSF4_9MICO|nr:TetR/AcrR family transcriptional regulator C-terminal domain-containing protein [Brevibacteriaceae bacterium ZFBP1038]
MPDDATLPEQTDRTLTLLWRKLLGGRQGSRGPKQKVSVDEIVTAAIAIADAEGLDTFSMRKVAEELRLGVMTLYTYVPGRAELIGLMVDQVIGEQTLSPHQGSVRERLTAIARLDWDEFHRHPWLLQANLARPWIGPHISDRYEWQLAAIEGIGLGDIDMDQIVTLVTGFAATAARADIDARRTQEQSGISDRQWWEINSPILERIMAGTHYPISGRVGQSAGEAYDAVSDPELSFRFGLERILDGIELFIDRKR